MKKYLSAPVAFLTMAMLLLTPLVSCSEDDELSVAELQEIEEKSNTFWDVVAQLVSPDNITDNYAKREFEPNIGYPESAGSSVRILETNDLVTAAAHFSNLIHKNNITAETSTYTWSNPEVGTLVYNRVNNGTTLATVDVDIKQVPGLQRIVYRPGGNGVNNSFSGKPYYRFGDVVKRTVVGVNGQVSEYWICIRPAFNADNKTKSYWACVNVLPAKNITSLTSLSSYTFNLPTNLGENRLQMQNFAELLYAIVNPDSWEENCQSNHVDNSQSGFSGLPIFSDLTLKNQKYNNKTFFTNVQRAWRKNAGVLNALNFSSFSDLEKMVNTDNEINLLYKGHSMLASVSWNLTLYEASFSNGVGEKSNMHDADYHNIRKDISPYTLLNFASMGKELLNYSQFWNASSGEDAIKRWAIRIADGDELNGAALDPTAQLQNGFQDVYRYYATYPTEYVRETDKGGQEISTFYYNYGAITPGTIIQDEEGTRWFCYAGWRNDSTSFITKDHKARFISLDNLTTAQEVLHTNSSKMGTFVTNEDLLPESEVEVAAVALGYLIQNVVDADSATAKECRDYLSIVLGRPLKDFQTCRDSSFTHDGVSISDGKVWAINLAYLPEDGRQSGTQPYLRYILDQSHLGSNTFELPAWLAYPALRFYKYYHDGTSRRLDLTHVFGDARFITEENPIAPDEWTLCRRTATHSPDTAFTLSNCYDVAFDALLFNKKPNTYQTAYREKALVLRYLELDNPSGSFLGLYDGKKYTIVKEPSTAMKLLIQRSSLMYKDLSRAHNAGPFPWCLLDDLPRDLDFLLFSTSWPSPSSE